MSSDLSKTDSIDEGETENRETPEVLRSEVNFLVLPFFALQDKDVRKRTKTEYRATVKRGEQKLEISWTVLANTEYGYPGPFEKRVHKAIEQIISELPFPVQNPIPLGSIYGLAKRMGLKTQGGQIYRRIKEALQRITLTGVISKGTFYDKESEQWIEDTFHLYERVIFKGKRLPNGEIADTNYLFPNNWYLNSINAHYVKPVDWDYYRSLEIPLAQRIYEFLSVKFYGIIMRGSRSISFKYSTLCDLLPVTRQRYLSKARGILDPAHERLKETGFLEDWTWEELPERKRRGEWRDWLITYYPGWRAMEEVERFKEYFEVKTAKTLPESDQEEELEPLTPVQADLVNRLMELNVSRSTAEDLVRSYDQEIIERWIEAIHYTRAGDKAAYLVKAIRQNWNLPGRYLEEKEKARKRAREEERKKRERKIREEEGKWLDEIYSSLSPSQRKEIDREIEARLPSFVKEMMREGRSESPIVKAAWKVKKGEVLKEWLKSERIHG
ncbi:MAG: hypothetical protein DRN13_03065 [Thermoplasmata archaeon]|nr:MAG: hypothetical protein DRN13_03065 [Thermoplasmata archaeon]